MLTIISLTLREVQSRRILWVGLGLGFLFLALFGYGFYSVITELPIDESNITLFVINTMISVGLYVVNFLTIIMGVLVSVTTISGEIESHTIDSLLTKPIARWQVVVGKWLAFALLMMAYTLLLAGGVLAISWWVTGTLPPHVVTGLMMMVLAAWVVLSLCIAGGTRLSTLANGVLAFMLYGIAFLGGWVEQIGAVIGNQTAVNIGIVSSLIMPSEVLWKKASILFQPELAIGQALSINGPFAAYSEPSNLMIGYSVAYLIGLLLFAIASFAKRDL